MRTCPQRKWWPHNLNKTLCWWCGALTGPRRRDMALVSLWCWSRCTSSRREGDSVSLRPAHFTFWHHTDWIKNSSSGTAFPLYDWRGFIGQSRTLSFPYIHHPKLLYDSWGQKYPVVREMGPLNNLTNDCVYLLWNIYLAGMKNILFLYITERYLKKNEYSPQHVCLLFTCN